MDYIRGEEYQGIIWFEISGEGGIYKPRIGVGIVGKNDFKQRIFRKALLKNGIKVVDVAAKRVELLVTYQIPN